MARLVLKVGGWFLPSGLGLLSCVLLGAGCGHTPGAAKPLLTAAAGEEPLPASDPVEFLQKCLENYDRQNIKGYRLIMQKQERVDGTLQPPEVVEVFYRARPRSVLMRWLQGARQAGSVLYVEGENGGKMLVHPTGLIGRLKQVVVLDPEGPRARHSGRHGIKEFGLRETLERTLKDWKAARDAGTLQARYLGVRKLAAAGDRPCYVLHRTSAEPDPEGVADATIFIDKETWFQTGTVLKGPQGDLVGEYVYRDIQLNPAFDPDPFQASALTP